MSDFSKVIIDKANAPDGQYHVWIPPVDVDDFDTDGWSHLGPAGDSYWPSLAEAAQFVADVFTSAHNPRTSIEYMPAPSGE